MNLKFLVRMWKERGGAADVGSKRRRKADKAAASRYWKAEVAADETRRAERPRRR
jgi:hypothetical protein